MKQTAVEWLIEGLDKIYHIKEKFLPSDWEFLEETSKKIEKEQMVDFAFKYGDLTTRQIADSFDKEYKTNEK
jgi:hypothetical protein